MALHFSAHGRSRSLQMSGDLTDRRTASDSSRYILALYKSQCDTGAMTSCRRNPTPRQQQTANGSMRLVKGAPNLMQRLSRLPAAPDVALLDRRKPKPFSWPHTTPPLKNRFITDGVASTH